MSAGPRPLLAFRPASVMHLLSAGSQACPLSLHELLRALAGARSPLPIVEAPGRAVLRAALVAARSAGAALGLSPPAGLPPGPWFRAVAEVAEELAPRLPLFLCGSVSIEPGPGGAERAAEQAWRLVDAGLTHLAVDVAALPAEERARSAAQAAAFAAEREIGVEVALPVVEGVLPAPEAAVAFRDELEARGLRPDALGATCAAPAAVAEVRAQARTLGALAGALDRTPLVRRGPATPLLLQVLHAAGVAVAADAGRVAAAGLAALPVEERGPFAEAQVRALRGGPEGAGADRFEARAFAEAQAFIEELGAGGSAEAVHQGLGGAGPG